MTADGSEAAFHRSPRQSMQPHPKTRTIRAPAPRAGAGDARGRALESGPGERRTQDAPASGSPSGRGGPGRVGTFQLTRAARRLDRTIGKATDRMPRNPRPPLAEGPFPGATVLARRAGDACGAHVASGRTAASRRTNSGFGLGVV